MAFSLLSDGLQKSDQTEQDLWEGYLLLVYSALMCNKYQESWRRLCELITLSEAIKPNNYILVIIFQTYLLGCSTALYLHKTPFAEYLGCRYVMFHIHSGF